jgi:hypothetical protein
MAAKVAMAAANSAMIASCPPEWFVSELGESDHRGAFPPAPSSSDVESSQLLPESLPESSASCRTGAEGATYGLGQNKEEKKKKED